MRTKFFLVAGALGLFAVVGRLAAGTLELQPKETAPPSITESEPWHFTIAAPVWAAGMDGTIGINGVNADINIGFDQILEHLNMVFSMRAEAQKGPFGIFGEVFYIGLSGGSQTSGLIDNISSKVDFTLVDGALSWRLINQPRGSLDLAAGTHYTVVYEQLTLNSNPVKINQASDQFVDNISEALRGRLNQDISNSEFIRTLKDTIREDITNRFAKALDRFENRPTIPIGPLGGRLRQEVARIVQDFIEVKKDVLKARIDALKLKGEARRAAVNRIVNAAKARISATCDYPQLETGPNHLTTR